MYRLQPLERDANDYANRETNRLFEYLEKKLGENIGFKEYKSAYQIDDKQDAIEDAIRAFGKNYTKEIDDTIHKEYLQIRQKGRLTYKINGLEFSVEKGKSQETVPSDRGLISKRNPLQEVKREIKNTRPLVLKREERKSGRGI